jgi:hypothetical protein
MQMNYSCKPTILQYCIYNPCYSTFGRENRDSKGEFDYRNRDSDPNRDPNQARLFSSDSDHSESGESWSDYSDSHNVFMDLAS